MKCKNCGEEIVPMAVQWNSGSPYYNNGEDVKGWMHVPTEYSPMRKMTEVTCFFPRPKEL